jgi:hypothetical protein
VRSITICVAIGSSVARYPEFYARFRLSRKLNNALAVN